MVERAAGATRRAMMLLPVRVAIAIILAASTTASAGVCEGQEQSADEGMQWIELFAKDKHAAYRPNTEDEAAWLCVQFFAKRERARIEKACTKILDRDGDTSECVGLAAFAGLPRLGTHDIFAIVSAYREDALDFPGGFAWPRLDYLAGMGDPRAVPIVVEQWKATIPRADKRKRSSDAMTSWAMWRMAAAKLLGGLGGADEQAFLEDQAKATIDKHVAQACRDGAAAIAKRLAAGKGGSP